MVRSDKDRKLAHIQRVPFWWHTIDLGDGVVTPGHSSLGVREDLQRDLAVELGVGGLPHLPSSRQESPRAAGRCSSSPLAACFRGGATVSRPYPG